MADRQESIDTIDTSNAHNTQNFSPEERVKRQQIFLEMFRETANIKFSCKQAGVSRQTFYNWRDHDTEFAALLPDAEADANDTLEHAAYDRAVNGVPSYVVAQGKLVRGPGKKPLIEYKYSDSLLTTLLKARLPQKYKEKQQLEHTGKDGGPLQAAVEIYKIRIPDNGRDTQEGGDA